MQREVASTLAAIKGCPFAGVYDPSHAPSGRLYFVPSDTLVGVDAAQQLGIDSEQDLYGGVVPFPSWRRRRSRTRWLTSMHSRPQVGRSNSLGACSTWCCPASPHSRCATPARRVRRCCAKAACVSRKRAASAGSGNRWSPACSNSKPQFTRATDDDWRNGLVLERNLSDVTTLSVGLVRVDDLLASYIGRQRLTRNNHGDEVYGGSTLTVVRGDFDALLEFAASPQIRTAVLQARAYHDAALQSFTGLFASRCNYDVAQGFDDAKQWRSGVLEQSWRVGGASCAEVAALQAFRADASLDVVRASTTEIYGPDPDVPPGARVYYSAVDEHAGMITKYSRLEPHGHA